MDEYIDRQELIENLNKFAFEHYNALVNQLIIKQPTADVLSIEEAAELLGRLEPTPCELKGNGWLKEICEHKDTCADTSDKDCWLQYLKYRNKKSVTEES